MEGAALWRDWGGVDERSGSEWQGGNPERNSRKKNRRAGGRSRRRRKGIKKTTKTKTYILKKSILKAVCALRDCCSVKYIHI